MRIFISMEEIANFSFENNNESKWMNDRYVGF